MQYIEKKQVLILRLLIFTIGLALYLNTLSHDYALDDAIVITENSFVQKGISGLADIFTNDVFTGFFGQKKELVQGGRYRPLSLAMFALEESTGMGRPGVRHFINALLYALVCVVLFETIRKLLLSFRMEIAVTSIAFVAAVVYAIHPVHTEAVANIKGRDEILATLFTLLSLQLYLKYLQNKSYTDLLFSGLSFFAGMLSKENTIVVLPFIILIPFMQGGGKKLKDFRIPLVYGLLTGTYLLLRFRYAGGFGAPGSDELMNNPFLHAGEQKLPTIIYTLLLYLKLLVFPYPLTFDYYPYHIPLQSWGSAWVWISLLLHGFLLIFALTRLRRDPAISFGIFFYLLSLFPVSNLLFPVGTFMNERFLFMPSAGFALVMGLLIIRGLRQIRQHAVQRTAMAILMIVVALASLHTLSRNKAWKNNKTLFLSDVKTSSGSAKGNCMAGGILYEEAAEMPEGKEQVQLLDHSVNYLMRAIDIYPDYVDAMLLLGNAVHLRDRDYQESLAYYQRIFDLQPGYDLAFQNLAVIFQDCPDPQLKITAYKTILQYRKNNFTACFELGVTYGKVLNKLDSARIYLGRALELRPGDIAANRNMGVACAMGGDFAASIPFFEKVVALDPGDPSNYINLGMSYRNTGYLKEASEAFLKAEELRGNQTIPGQ